MKRTLLFILAIILLSVSSFSEDAPSIDLANYSSDKVLLLYKEMSKRQMIEASNVKNHHKDISLRATGNTAELLKAIEKALVEQAGIVVTFLDDKKVSVTFNDALPITPEVRKNPTNVKLLR